MRCRPPVVRARQSDVPICGRPKSGVAYRCSPNSDATSFTRRNARRKFALSDCNLPAKVSIAGYKNWPTAPIVRFPASRHRWIRKAARFIHAMGDILGADASHKKFSVFVERGMAFEPGFCELGAQTYLAGFWQSARYFDHVGHLIRNDLRLTRKPNAANAQWLQRILAATRFAYTYGARLSEQRCPWPLLGELLPARPAADARSPIQSAIFRLFRRLARGAGSISSPATRPSSTPTTPMLRPTNCG